MPRTEIDLPCRVERLSILDEHGELDQSLEPDIPDDFLLKMHRAMLSGRRFDERLLNLQRQGRIGTFAPISGQEAAQLGAAVHLRRDDWMVPCFRESLAETWRGKDPASALLYFAGYDEGGRPEDDRNDLPIAVPVGSQTLHAVGLAWGMKYREKDSVAMTFFGDGATSEGDFHEAMNFAGVFTLPVIFVCQNNQWAISVPRSKQTRSKTLAQKAIAYGIPGIQVDGNDILAVYTAVGEAVDRARKGEGPTLIECETYRIMMHTTADDPKRYRSEDEVNEWKKKDPIVRYQTYLKNKGLLTDKDIEGIEEEIKAEIQTAVEHSEKMMKDSGDPLDMFLHTFQELTPALEEQKEELSRELSERRQEADHG